MAMILYSCLGGPFSQQDEIRGNCAQFFSAMIPVVPQLSEWSTSSVSETIVIVHAIRRRGDHTGKFHHISVVPLLRELPPL